MGSKAGISVRKAKPKNSPCNCIADANAQLKQHNGAIEQRFQFSFAATTSSRMSNPLISLVKLDKTKRKKPPILVATHCPFCGKKYPE